MIDLVKVERLMKLMGEYGFQVVHAESLNEKIMLSRSGDLGAPRPEGGAALLEARPRAGDLVLPEALRPRVNDGRIIRKLTDPHADRLGHAHTTVIVNGARRKRQLA